MLTIEDVWKSSLPEGTELAGGAAGLGRQVTWVARMLPRPPGFGSFKGGEIALVSSNAMKTLDERLTLVEVMRRLVEKGVCGIAALGKATAEAIAFSEEHSIPLLILPEGANLFEVEQGVTRLIVETRAELYQRGQEIFVQLTELAIEGKGVSAIIKKLSTITGKTIGLETEEFVLQDLVLGGDGLFDYVEGQELLAQARDDLANWARSISPNPSEPPATVMDLPRLGIARLTAPISTKERVWGYLSVIGAREAISETDRLAVVRATAACAIEIARDRAVLEAQDRLQSDFLEDILTGNFPNAETALARGRRMGYALNPPYAVLALEGRDARKDRNGSPATGPIEQIVRRLERESARSDPSYLSHISDKVLVLLVPVAETTDATQLKKLAEDLRNRLAATVRDVTVTVGVGRLHPDIEGIKRAFEQSKQALGMGMRLFGEGSISYFGDLGIYRLLFSLHGTPDLYTFHNETLGKLLEYDQKNRADLVKTLQAYFGACGSLTDAAEQLHLHRNTLLYRLHRIREIASLDLEDPETRLALQLALHISETLQATATGTS